MEIEISIITVNYNGVNDTCELIDSIPSNDNMEVIVIDNGSREDEGSLIAQRYPQVKIIRSDRNLGFAGGNNLGIKAAKGKYIFLINNDTVFKDFNIQPIINRLKSSHRIGLVCPKIRFEWGNNLIQYAGYTPLSRITARNRSIGFGEEDNGQYNIAHSTPYAHGAAMLIKRDAIYEEIDWSMMFTKADYEIWYDPSCTIYHKESQSTGQNSPLRTYFMTRNRLLLVKRNWRGIYKFFAYCYLMCIVAPRDLFKYAFKGRYDLSRAACKGVIDFCRNRKQKCLMYNV